MDEWSKSDAQTRDVVAEVAGERYRQKSAEGWTPEHDDEHDGGALAAAAACYAAYPYTGMSWRRIWPWDHSWWKPTTRRRDLVKAAALIVAEIERLDRAAGRAALEQGGPS